MCCFSWRTTCGRSWAATAPGTGSARTSIVCQARPDVRACLLPAGVVQPIARLDADRTGSAWFAGQHHRPVYRRPRLSSGRAQPVVQNLQLRVGRRSSLDHRHAGLGKRGAASPLPVELLDLYPALAELCGLAKPTHLEGASLVPALKDPIAEVKPFAIMQHPRPAYYTKEKPEVMGYSLRTRHHRYTEWRKWRTGEVVARELYDHQNDPGENKNVAAESAKRVQDLSRKLAKVHPVKHLPAND